MENILLIRLKSIGDVLFTLPAVNAVRTRYPGAKITFLTSSENATLLAGFPAVDEIITVDRNRFHHGGPAQILSGVIQLLGRLRRGDFSLAFDFQGYGETEWLAWWSGAPVRWGIVYQPGRGWAYTGITGRRNDVHPVEWNLALLRAAGLDTTLAGNEYLLPEAELARARDYFRAHHLDPQRITLFLQPFTSNPGKNWPLTYFIELARRARDQGYQVIFGGGPADAETLAPARAAGFLVAAGTPLAVSAGLMKLSSLVVGGDTGLLHLAVAMQKRVLMLMRSKEPGSCHPYQHLDWALTPERSLFMADLPPDRVWEAVTQALAEKPPQLPATRPLVVVSTPVRQVPEKILAIQFKYLGDAVFLTPALRALREHRPAAELHVLVASEIAPLLEHIPWITKVWSLPRTRGKARIRDSWPVIRALHRQGFDRSVDFGGNDRGAIMSYLSGARVRLGAVDEASLVQKFCYSKAVSTATLPPSYVQSNLQLLADWQVPPPSSLALEVATDPTQAEAAARLLPPGTVICHLSTSQPRKEWPLTRWQEFYRLARAAGFSLAFSSGPGPREKSLLTQLKQMEPEIFALPVIPSLKLFLAVIQRARAVVACDTGPLHFAAGLGLPVVGLFGADDSLWRAAPNYPAHQVIKSTEYAPAGAAPVASDPSDPESRLADIPAGRVLETLIAITSVR